jgi:multimeric flavodoxin WrbA
MIRVLGIHASPRKYGNSFKLLWIALRAAENEGAETEIIHLYDYNIGPCFACYSDYYLNCRYPKERKECPLSGVDRFGEVAEKILASDAVVFSTPVYWFMASGVLKNLFDRMTSLENMIYHVGRSLLDGKVAGVIAVGEEAGAAMALSWALLTLVNMGFHIPAWGTTYYHGKGDVLEDKQAVSDAYNLGLNIVRATKRLRGSNEAPWYRFIGEDEYESLVEEARKVAEKNKAEQRRERPWLK